MQYKFSKTKDPENKYDTSNVVVESNGVTLSELLEDFGGFLKACGFQFYELDAILEKKLMKSEKKSKYP
jgi:hypothetical protein